MKVRLFYRDGDNYKCNWVTDISEDFDLNDIDLDPEYKSDSLIEIESLGLTTSDIPLIQEFGEGNMDHNFVSIIEVKL